MYLISFKEVKGDQFYYDRILLRADPVVWKTNQEHINRSKIKILAFETIPSQYSFGVNKKSFISV